MQMSDAVGFSASTPAVWRPRHAEEAYRLKKQFGHDAAYVSGGTLLRTQWENGSPVPGHLIDLSGAAGWKVAAADNGTFAIGAQTTLSACRGDPQLQALYPLIVEASRSIAAPSIRNLATIGGNVSSGVGDSLPALLVYEAQLDWYDDGGERTEALEDWLRRVPDGTAQTDSLLLRVRLPLESANLDPSEISSENASLNADPPHSFAYYAKIGRRDSFVPSAVTTALTGTIDGSGRLRRVRLAAGGGKTIPRRYPEAEARLEGQAADDRSVHLLHAILMASYTPAPDPFLSDEYRKRTAANVAASHLWRAIREFAQGKEGERCC